MSTRDLCQNPVWEGKELGRPIPESSHAISVALPRWQDVTGYEEGRPDVIEKLVTGYPRFVVHSFVRALAGRLSGEGACLPFPSLRVAELCADFIRRSSGEAAGPIPGKGVTGVATSDHAAGALWRTGLGGVLRGVAISDPDLRGTGGGGRSVVTLGRRSEAPPTTLVREREEEARRPLWLT